MYFCKAHEFGASQPIAYWLATVVGGVVWSLCRNPILTIPILTIWSIVHKEQSSSRYTHTFIFSGISRGMAGSVAEWLACWTQAQKGLV